MAVTCAGQSHVATVSRQYTKITPLKLLKHLSVFKRDQIKSHNF